MKATASDVKRRRKELAASPHSKADVMRLARVSERMIYFWYRGEKTSAKVAAAHAALTGNGAVVREKVSA